MTIPSSRIRMRRSEAAQYLGEQHGIPIAKATLDKLASIGGGPPIVYFGRIPLYARADLDIWAAGRLSKAVNSTAERGAAGQASHGKDYVA